MAHDLLFLRGLNDEGPEDDPALEPGTEIAIKLNLEARLAAKRGLAQLPPKDPLDHLDESARRISEYDRPFWTLVALIRWVAESTRNSIDGMSVHVDRAIPALLEVRDALARGDLPLFARIDGSDVPVPLLPEVWEVYGIAYVPFFDESCVQVIIGREDSEEPVERFQDLSVRRDDAIHRWPPADAPAPLQKTHMLENRCAVWLEMRMRLKRRFPEPKNKLRDEAYKLFPGLGARPFQSAWDRAVRGSGAYEWSEAGRRKGSKTEHRGRGRASKN